MDLSHSFVLVLRYTRIWMSRSMLGYYSGLSTAKISGYCPTRPNVLEMLGRIDKLEI